MKLNLRVLLLLTFINMQLLNAVILDDKGITTEKGFISWEQVIEMQNRMNSLENIRCKTIKKENSIREYSVLEKAAPIVQIGALLIQILTRFPL